MVAAALMSRLTSKRIGSFDDPLPEPSPRSYPIPPILQPPPRHLSDDLEVWLWTAHAYLSQGPEERRGGPLAGSLSQEVHQRLAWCLPGPTTSE